MSEADTRRTTDHQQIRDSVEEHDRVDIDQTWTAVASRFEVLGVTTVDVTVAYRWSRPGGTHRRATGLHVPKRDYPRAC